jgi:hypothetical protein
MGKLRDLNRGFKKERARTRAFQLSKSLQEFYANNLVGATQRDEVGDIRRAFEHAMEQLNVAHDHATSRISEQYMQFELDYLRASQEWKVNNPGMEWHREGIRGVFAGAFWRNMARRAGALKINVNGTEEKAD